MAKEQHISIDMLPHIINTEPSDLSMSTKPDNDSTTENGISIPVPNSTDPLSLYLDKASSTDFLSTQKIKHDKVSSTDFLASRRHKYNKSIIEDTYTNDEAGEHNFKYAKHKLQQYTEHERKVDHTFTGYQDPCMLRCKKHLKVILTIVGVFVGLCVGLIVGLTYKPSDLVIKSISFPGELFMRMLSLLSLPLITACIISDVSSLYTGALGRMGKYIIIFYIATTIMGVGVGTALAVVLNPGHDFDITSSDPHVENYTKADAIFDLLRNIVPDNLVKVGFERTHKDGENPETIKKHSSNNGINLLGVVTCSFAFGFILRELKERAQIMIDFFGILEEVTMRFYSIIMWISPLGIASLVASTLIKEDDYRLLAQRFGLYIFTVTLGLATHLFVSLFSIYFILTRSNPFTFFKGMFPAWVKALTTSSSNGTLPITMRCLDKNLGIDRRITRFVMPIGLIMNKDGTALTMAVAAIFITQLNNLSLDIDTLLTISLTSIFVSVGTGGLPGSAIVALVPVLQSLDLPLTDLTLILAIDWLVDRMRTSVNIFGDAVAVGIAQHFNTNKLNVVVVDIERCVQRAKENASKLEIGGYVKKTSAFSLLLQETPEPSSVWPSRLET